MIPKEGELPEDLQLPPRHASHQISEGAVRVTSEALQNVSGSLGVPPARAAHRRSHSEVVTSSANRGGNNIPKWKTHMQRALRWGNNFQGESPFSSFNPEVLANQKRQWYQLHSKTSVCFYPDFKVLIFA